MILSKCTTIMHTSSIQTAITFLESNTIQLVIVLVLVMHCSLKVLRSKFLFLFPFLKIINGWNEYFIKMAPKDSCVQSGNRKSASHNLSSLVRKYLEHNVVYIWHLSQQDIWNSTEPKKIDFKLFNYCHNCVS